MKEEMTLVEAARRRGRGARSNRSGRFESARREAFDDGWDNLNELEPFRTHVHDEVAKSIISRNTSPDIGFEYSINPYRGCEHGCIYCYARPTHCSCFVPSEEVGLGRKSSILRAREGESRGGSRAGSRARVS